MDKSIVILTKSDKYGGYCVAGLDIETNSFIRLTSNFQGYMHSIPRDFIVYNNKNPVEILDCVRVTNLTPAPTKIQHENFLVTEMSTFKFICKRDINEVYGLCPKYDNTIILGNSFHYLPASIDQFDHSLEMIKFKSAFACNTQYNKTKLHFNYEGRMYNNFSITDPLQYLHDINDKKLYYNGYLIISIPDDDWSRNNGFYKFVAKIYDKAY